MSPLTVKVTRRGEVFEGTVELRGLRPTKLTRSDNTTQFASLSALKTTARSVAQRLGTTVEYVETKQAAKTSVKSKTATPTPSNSTVVSSS